MFSSVSSAVDVHDKERKSAHHQRHFLMHHDENAVFIFGEKVCFVDGGNCSIAGFIFVQCAFFVQNVNVHLFSDPLPRFDKCHETSRIFPRTEQTFVSARSFGVIFS